MREGEGRGKDRNLLLGGRALALVICSEGFISLLQVGFLGEASGEDLNRIFISFPGVSFQGCGLY